MNKPSKFASLIEEAKKGPEPDEVAKATPEAEPEQDPPALPHRGRGRPKGKRSNPDFEQVGAHIPSKLYERVRIAIIQDGRRQDFSELVAELLTGWLDQRSNG